MEIKQSTEMGKAVLSPPSLCTVVLSAIASVMDEVADDTYLPSDTNASKVETIDDANSDDDSDEEDLPLNALAKVGSKPDSAVPSDGSTPKRPKLNSNASTVKTKIAPNPRALAKILRHISKTHGRIFQEPSHANYAWYVPLEYVASIQLDAMILLPKFFIRQQRHLTLLTSPLPREIMFKGNPRKPGHLSFENIQFMIDDDRIKRLELTSSVSEVNTIDEWIVNYLSSDQVTGLCHEIDILESLGLVEIKSGGEICLASGWQKLCPHMILNEMRDTWGKDIHVIICQT